MNKSWTKRDVLVVVGIVAPLIMSAISLGWQTYNATMDTNSSFVREQTKDRLSACFALSSHHYEQYKRWGAPKENNELVKATGGVVLESTNLERAGKSADAARAIALCRVGSIDMKTLKKCITDNVDNSEKYKVWDDPTPNSIDFRPREQAISNSAC